MVNNTDGSYYDQRNDFTRLVNLVVRRTETLVDREKACMAKIDDISFRCAKMMQHAFQNQVMHIFSINAKTTSP